MYVGMSNQAGFGGILDDASAAVARGISSGVSSALPQVQTAIQQVVRDVLPMLQSRLTDAIKDGLTRGAMTAKTELSQATTDLLPALEDSVVRGGTKLFDKAKPWLIGFGVAACAGLVAVVALQYEQVRLLKSGRR